LEVVGTAVLVSTPQYGPCILTAAHVVNAALGNDLYSTESPTRDKRVAFDIPVKGVGPERTYLGAVVEWSRPVRASQRMDTPEATSRCFRSCRRVMAAGNFRQIWLSGLWKISLRLPMKSCSIFLCIVLDLREWTGTSSPGVLAG
jgi:hypothetical protein